MNHYGFHRHWHRPSRLLWFIFGAGFATWWIKSKEAHHWHASWRARYCARQQLPADAYPPPQGAEPSTSAVEERFHHHHHHHPWGRGCSRDRIPNEAYPPPPAVAESYSVPISGPTPTAAPQAPRVDTEPQNVPLPPSPSPAGHPDQVGIWNWSWPTGPTSPPPPMERWEDERKRMQEIGVKAHDTFQDMTEATLDTLLSTVEMMKAKLAEHRAERDREAAELKAMKDEQMRQYEEWKKQQPPRHLV